MWKHKTLGFTVSDVIFDGEWVKFNNSGVPDILAKDKFLATYEEVK